MPHRLSCWLASSVLAMFSFWMVALPSITLRAVLSVHGTAQLHHITDICGSQDLAAWALHQPCIPSQEAHACITGYSSSMCTFHPTQADPSRRLQQQLHAGGP